MSQGTPAPASSTGAEQTGVLYCPGCNAPAAAGCKFCTQCGKTLWDTCYQCGAMVTARDRYCGTCGTDLVEGPARQAEAIRQTLARAHDLCRQMDYDAARQELAAVVEIRHTALVPLVEEARQALRRIDDEQKSQAARLEALESEAETLLAQRRYREALRKLEVVPPAIRTPKLARHLAEASARLEEIDALGRQLRESAGAPFSMELVRMVGRLLELDPHHGHARQVMERIHRRLVRAASDLLAERRYDEASKLLEHVPRAARTEEIAQLHGRAMELGEMARVLRTSPAATPALAALAERFLRLAPQDPQAAAWCAEITARLQQEPWKLVRTARPAAVPGNAEKAGPAVTWLPHLPGLTLGPDVDGSVLRQHAGRFAVACGLALQGLGMAAFPINLQPDEPALLEKVWRRLNQRAARSAWGIDLGTAALKAVKLIYAGRHEPPRLAAADLIEHRKPLSHATGAEEVASILVQTVEQFAARNDLRADRCCLGLPQGMQLLRRVELPLLDPQRMARAVAFEAKSQFPVPLSDLAWDYVVAERPQTSPSPNGAAQASKRGLAVQGTSRKLAGIWVLAAKRFLLRDILLRIQASGLRVDAIQGAPLALANFLHWTAFGQTSASATSPAGAAAALDLGCEGMTFLTVAQDLLWLRQTSLGASRVAHFLARQRHIPLARAEQWMRNPAEADSPAAVLADMNAVFDDYCQELRESLRAFRAANPERRLQQLLLVGGGMLMLGLLARLDNTKETRQN